MPNTANFMNEILENQSVDGIAVLAFVIPQSCVEEIKISLQPDEPTTGAIGRFEGRPVFVLPNMPNELSEMHAHTATFEGIQYSYLKLVTAD